MHVQKIKEEKLTYETYLESVDGLRNDEECRSPVKINLLRLDLGVAMSQTVTLAPPFNLLDLRNINRSNKRMRSAGYGKEKRIKSHQDKNNP